jgi:hypothetical protein
MIRSVCLFAIATFACFGFAQEPVAKPPIPTENLLPDQDVGSSQ